MEQAEEAKILGSKKQQALPHNLNAKVREGCSLLGTPGVYE